ncbi:MAG: hypothetical protein HYX79_10895 [Chloroflexi bacterium]|nr:hypothetical protein [Chloroflexota bacterium]
MAKILFNIVIPVKLVPYPYLSRIEPVSKIIKTLGKDKNQRLTGTEACATGRKMG